MATVLGDARVSVSLDVAQAKRQIEELRKAIRDQRTQKAEPAQRIVKKLEREGRDVSGGKAERNEKSISQSLLAAAGRRLQQVAARGATGLAPATALAGQAASAVGPRGAAVAKGIGTAALIYGAVRVGTEARVFLDQVLASALPDALTKNPVFSGLVEFRRELAKRMDALEASVKASIVAAGTSGEYAIASARIAGASPGFAALGAQYKDDFTVEKEKAKLDSAFSRFRRDDLARSIGRTIGDAAKGTFTR